MIVNNRKSEDREHRGTQRNADQEKRNTDQEKRNTDQEKRNTDGEAWRYLKDEETSCECFIGS